jgi:hypothetical protein
MSKTNVKKSRKHRQRCRSSPCETVTGKSGNQEQPNLHKTTHSNRNAQLRSKRGLQNQIRHESWKAPKKGITVGNPWTAIRAYKNQPRILVSDHKSMPLVLCYVLLIVTRKVDSKRTLVSRKSSEYRNVRSFGGAQKEVLLHAIPSRDLSIQNPAANSNHGSYQHVLLSPERHESLKALSARWSYCRQPQAAIWAYKGQPRNMIRVLDNMPLVLCYVFPNCDTQLRSTRALVLKNNHAEKINVRSFGRAQKRITSCNPEPRSEHPKINSEL